jgi:hypothetical protein
MFIIEETLNACFAGPGYNLPMPSWSPQANETLLLAVVTNQPVLAVYDVSGNGLVWTQIAAVENARGVANGIVLFRASSPTTPTSGVVTFTVDAPSQYVKAILTRISGVDITTDDGVEAFSIAPGGVSDNADLKVDVTPVLDGAFVFAFAGNSRASSSIVSLPVGQSVVFQDLVDCGTGWYRLRAQFWQKNTPVNPAETFTLGKDASLNASAPWAAIAVALSSAAAPVVENPTVIVVLPNGRVRFVPNLDIVCTDLLAGTDKEYFFVDIAGPVAFHPITIESPIPNSADTVKCVSDGKILHELLFKS